MNFVCFVIFVCFVFSLKTRSKLYEFTCEIFLDPKPYSRNHTFGLPWPSKLLDQFITSIGASHTVWFADQQCIAASLAGSYTAC